jgi:hypothetical protein
MGTPRPELSIRSRAFNVNPEEERIAPPQQRRRGDRRQPHGSLLTRRWREVDSNFRFRARGAIDLSFRLSSMLLKLFVFCRTNIRSRPRWRLLSSCTRTPNGRLATGDGRDSLSAALTSRE